MENSLIASIKYYVLILILYSTLLISVYLAWIDKYFNIDKQYQHYFTTYETITQEVKLGVLHPIQQSGSYWDRSSDLNPQRGHSLKLDAKPT